MNGTSNVSVRYIYKVSLLSCFDRLSKGDLDTQEGISLLSVKNNVMVQYLQNLVLLSAHRALGNSLTERTPPSKPWGDMDRDARGNNGGDRVDAMIESRVVLEKMKLMEGKMKYQIDKLVKLAEEEPGTAGNAENGALAKESSCCFVD